jgi:S-adenosylmethionine synthetase
MSHGACIPLRVHTVVVSVQHSEKISLEELRTDVMTKVITVVIPEKYLDDGTTFHINPCGLFVVGGPQVSSCSLCHLCFVFYVYELVAYSLSNVCTNIIYV